jgi:TonB family protein
MKKICSIVLLILSFSAFVFSQENPYKVKASVKDQDKTPLAGLNLYFNDGNKILTFVTDENGDFTAELITGKWTIKTNPIVSKTFTAYLEIQKDASSNPNNFELTVELNKESCQTNKPIEVLKYVAPKYPPAAKAVRASGEVIVNVKIDKDGKVVSAKVLSGHPLLQAISAKFAQMWLFSSDNLAERECQIVFAFVLTKKEKLNADILRKPNRLEVFSDIPTLR